MGKTCRGSNRSAHMAVCKGGTLFTLGSTTWVENAREDLGLTQQLLAANDCMNTYCQRNISQKLRLSGHPIPAHPSLPPGRCHRAFDFMTMRSILTALRKDSHHALTERLLLPLDSQVSPGFSCTKAGLGDQVIRHLPGGYIESKQAHDLGPFPWQFLNGNESGQKD